MAVMLTMTKIRKILYSSPFLGMSIFLFSAYFRVTNLDLIEFKRDEALNIFLAAQPLFGKGFMPGGTVSSLGFLNPPLFNYFLFPLIAISADPRFISACIAVINALSIIAFFFLIKKYYSLATAFITCLLFSFAPWAILYSRKIWMQDLLIPFVILLLYSIHKLIIDKKEKYLFLYVFSAMMLIQLHPVSIVFLSIITAFMVAKRVKINLKYVLWGLLIGAIPLIPYIIFEIQNKCPDCYALISSRNRLNSQYSLETFLRPLQIVGIGNFHFILGPDTLTLGQMFPLVYKARQLLYLEYLLLPLGAVIFILKEKKLSFLAYSVIATAVAYFFLKIESFMHYYIILLPLLFLLLANSFTYLMNKHYVLKFISICLLLLLVLESIAFNISFFNFLKIQGRTKGDYGAVFILSKNNSDRRLTKYKNTREFEEIFLTNYIPISYMYGYLPLGKMLYSDLSLMQIPQLEKELSSIPEDNRPQLKLLYLNTQTPETPQTITALRRKSEDIPEYIPIYREILNHYMGVHLKKQYSGTRHSFFYPEHWSFHEDPDGTIKLGSEQYEVSIKNLGLNNMDISCAEIKTKCDSGTIAEIKNSILPL